MELKITLTSLITTVVLLSGTKVVQASTQPKELIRPFIAYETTTTKPKIVEAPKYLYRGKVSYYSHAGCLGCSKGQKMGNGQPFKEEALTLAVPCEDVKKPAKVQYNTRVLVTNENNGKTATAMITDCGGFSKYNRVADLSKGLAEALDAKTDKSTIRIEVL